MSSDLTSAESDDYIVCDECEGKFILGDCPDHGPLVWVDDCQETHPGPAKNVTSLPSDLCLKPSAVMQGHLGVFTKENIKKRVIFGPFKGQAIPFEELNVGDNFMRLWEVFKDGKVSCIVDGTDEQHGNWMRFVNCARDIKEQNLVVTQFHGEIYFRTCVPVPAGSELLVWYSESYPTKVNSSSQKEENGHPLACESCELVFPGPIWLRRHQSIQCPIMTKEGRNQPLVSSRSSNTDELQPSDKGVSIEDSTISPEVESSYVVVHLGNTIDDRTVIQAEENSSYVVVHVQPAPTETTRSSKRPSVNTGRVTSRKKTKRGSVPQLSTVNARKEERALTENGVVDNKKSGEILTKPRGAAAKKPSPSKRDSARKRRSTDSAPSRSKASKFRQRAVEKPNQKATTQNPRAARTISSCGKKTLDKGDGNNDTTENRSTKAAKTTKTRKLRSQPGTTNSSSGVKPSLKPGGTEGVDDKIEEQFIENTPPKDKQLNEAEGEEEGVEPPKEKSTVAKGKKKKGPQVYTCKICLGSFKWNSALQYHMRKHMSEKEFRCEICNKGLSQVSSLNRHMRMHRGERPHECQECGKRFLEKGKLVLHQRLHAGEPPEKKFKCNMCDRGFTLSANLRTHMRIHTGEKPYSCPQCGKAFKRSSDVSSHLRSHTGERPYKCSQCPKAFTMLSHRNRHQLIHTGEKPFKCDLCGKGFTQPSSVKAHLKVHEKRQARLEGVREGQQENRQKKTAPKDAAMQTDGEAARNEYAKAAKGCPLESLPSDTAQKTGTMAEGITEEAPEVGRTEVIGSENVQLENEYVRDTVAYMITGNDAMGLLQLAATQVNQHEHLNTDAPQIELRVGAEITTIAQEQLELSCANEPFEFVTTHLNGKGLLPLPDNADRGNGGSECMQLELGQDNGGEASDQQDEQTLLEL